MTAPLLVLFGAPAFAQLNERVSVATGGAQADGAALPSSGVFVSSSGRYIAFISDAGDLVTGDTNGVWDVFVRDRLLGTTERASINWLAAQANGPSGYYGLCISKDGRYVVFESRASNLDPVDTNGVGDIFIRDRVLGSTERVSVDSFGVQANAPSYLPSISADGRFVAFISPATNLAFGDTNGVWDVFVRDRQNGTTDRVTLGVSGAQSNGDSDGGTSISDDGRFVAFTSHASNLVPGDVNGVADAFTFDRATGLTELISVSVTGLQANSRTTEVAISGDGLTVAFTSFASNLVVGDTNGYADVFVRDRTLLTIAAASVGPSGIQANNSDSNKPGLSEDGRYVVFASGSSVLVAGDTGWIDVFIRDRAAGTTERVSVAAGGAQAAGSSDAVSVSADGRYAVFWSLAANLVAGDTNGHIDVFLRDRLASGFTSFCSPGSNNVIACPCANPPSSLGRGCDNSALTGGATLSASGAAYLALDSLVFVASGEKPNATSILLQGTADVPTGVLIGQGVRCVGGLLKRLYVRTAANGSVTVPDLAAGDPSVSMRSASLGVPIQPGQPFYYLVYYRDPIVLGGCVGTITFNATQSGSVSWWP